MDTLTYGFIDYFSFNVQEVCVSLKGYLMQQPVTFAVLHPFSSEISKVSLYSKSGYP